MSWPRFLKIFFAVQFTGILLSTVGLFVGGYYALFTGWLLLFPGILIGFDSKLPDTPFFRIVGLGLVLLINLTLWVGFLRPAPRIKISN